MTKIDMVGKKYNFLTVIEDLPPRISKGGFSTRMVLCECECGKRVKVQAQHLRTGNTLSCGCKARDFTILYKTTHGLSKTRIFKIWQGMKRRCSKNAGEVGKYYYDKGIRVCKEWSEDFMNFYNWAMEHGYSEELTIDRIDYNGDYEPKNCRWVDYKTQNNNKSNNIIVSYKGETMSLTQWAERYGVPSRVFHSRKRKGWDTETIFNTPYKQTLRQIGE
jgi:tRNA-binding EMAP/Myf-like protein